MDYLSVGIRVLRRKRFISRVVLWTHITLKNLFKVLVLFYSLVMFSEQTLGLDKYFNFSNNRFNFGRNPFLPFLGRAGRPFILENNNTGNEYHLATLNDFKDYLLLPHTKFRVWSYEEGDKNNNEDKVRVKFLPYENLWPHDNKLGDLFFNIAKVFLVLKLRKSSIIKSHMIPRAFIDLVSVGSLFSLWKNAKSLYIDKKFMDLVKAAELKQVGGDQLEFSFYHENNCRSTIIFGRNRVDPNGALSLSSAEREMFVEVVREKKHNIVLKSLSSFHDLRKIIDDEVKRGNKIEDLILSAHGSISGVIIGDKVITSVSDIIKDGMGIGVNPFDGLSPDGKIILAACNTGAHKTEEGNPFAQVLANASGRKVVAPTGPLFNSNKYMSLLCGVQENGLEVTMVKRESSLSVLAGHLPFWMITSLLPNSHRMDAIFYPKK